MLMFSETEFRWIEICVMRKLIYVLCVLYGMSFSVQAHATPSEPRGELLYSTYCNACHTSTIHWRKRRLVTDWESLKAQVNRWQAYNQLGWNEEEILDVALYLNVSYYDFLGAGPKALSQANNLSGNKSE
jgi:hypothetical protein